MDFATASKPPGVARCWPPVARADASGSAPDTGAGLPAPAMQRLKQRADFLAATAGAKAPAGGFVLQARDRQEDGPVRVGFTCSKKVGNAVERNRVRRRLREVVRLAPPDRMRRGYDYVLIGRSAALNLPFSRLVEDFERALSRVHASRPNSAGPGTGPSVRAGKGPSVTPHRGTR
jgi:ribonuclease P protein component